ncbi:MAG: hypothetical protein ACREA2_18490 [Blastocatellia bacterium]
MRVRRRRTNRRSKRATAPAPPPITPPPDLTAEIEQSVEARDRLEDSVASFAAERDQSKSAFLRSFAGEMSAVVFDANRALDRFAAWQTQEARATQAAGALNQLSAMIKERVEQFKSNSKGESVAALRRIIERLTAERDKPGADKNAINKRIERLLAEQESMGATSPPAPPAPPKDKPTPSPRPPGKPRPRERGEI